MMNQSSDSVRVELSSQVAGYTILRKIGEGAMGEVYEAMQHQPVRRHVAIKMIKADLASIGRVKARFESERQALALMEHPSIARVFDAGITPQGRPFIAMEHVEGGKPIDVYCDENRLTNRQRLELFANVCDAVQHAHQKGIIHRDLKASNVLVHERDGKAVPKIIDFGVAKATQPTLDHSTATSMGLLVGTPEYMSPEQTGITASEDIDTRADVYSLGVLLYRLITGAMPFDLTADPKMTAHEFLRRIREETPRRPSDLLTATRPGIAEVVRVRNTERNTLRRQTRGDLDWIVMKTLEKDRGRRYATVNALGVELRRYLRNDPVIAGPPGRWYRARKFCQRHRIGVTFAGALVLVLVGFAVTMTIQAHRLGLERDRTSRKAETVQRISEFLVGLFDVADPHETDGNGMTAREVLDRGVTRIREELAGEPEVAARLMHTMGRVYFRIGEYEEAESLLDDALTVRIRSTGPRSLGVAETLNNLGNLLWKTGRYDEARPRYEKSLSIRQELLPADHPMLAASFNNLAVLLKSTGEFEEAKSYYYRALEIWERTSGPDSDDVAMTLNNLAVLYKAEGDYETARRHIQRALAIREVTLGPNHPRLAFTLHNYGNVQRATGQLVEARKSLERARAIKRASLGPQHPSVAWTLNSLAFLDLREGDVESARRRHGEATEILEQALGLDHPQVLYDMACYNALTGEIELALEYLRRSIQAGLEAPGLVHDPDLEALRDHPEFRSLQRLLLPE